MISIAIPAYKAIYLKEAIESVLNQTVQDFELIIVNDASPNPITDIVEMFKDPRIHYYINEKNIGGSDPVCNWNKCLSYAKGDYFCLLCDDDIYEPQFLEEMLRLACLYPSCNVFKSGVKVINENKQITHRYPVSPEWEPCDDYIINASFRLRRQTISEWMFRRSHMLLCGGYEPTPIAWGADYLSIMKFAVEGGITSSKETFVVFRKSGSNISTIYDSYSEMKLYGIRVYQDKLNALIMMNFANRKDELLAASNRIADWEQKCIMGNTSPSVLWKLRYNVTDYGVHYHSYIWALLKNIIKKIIRYKG